MSDKKKPPMYSVDEVVADLMASREKDTIMLAGMKKKFPKDDGIEQVLDDDYLLAEWGEYKE